MAAIVNFFKSISPFKSAEPEEEPRSFAHLVCYTLANPP